MKKQIKTAIIVDPSGAMGKTAEQEVAEHIKTFRKAVRPAVLKPYRNLSAGDIKSGTDLVVYDFGGMLPGTSLMEDNARYLARWAEDNPNALVVVVSTFTYRNYVQVELEENDLNLPNIVCDDGKRDLCDVMPDWWKDKFGIETPNTEGRIALDDETLDNLEGKTTDLDKKLDTEYDELVRQEEEAECAKNAALQAQKDAKNAELRKTLSIPVAHITVPVCRDWKPGQKDGFLRWKLADSVVDVTEGKGKDEKVVARIGGTFNGFYEISFPDGKGNSWVYSIGPEAFWDAFKKMHDELLAAEGTA